MARHFLQTSRTFIESYPLMLLACLLVLLGVSGSWVNMPLSGEQNLNLLESPQLGKQIKLLVLSMLVLYCLATILKWRIARVLFATALFSFLLYFALTFSFLNNNFVWQYIIESQSFHELTGVLAFNPTPNTGPSAETALIYDAYRFSERLMASASLLGWGAKLTVLCSSLLLVYAVIKSRQVMLSAMLVSVLMLTFVVTSGVANVGLAYLKLNQGIRYANQNSVELAINEFKQAKQLDPVLASSKGFSVLLSYMYHIAYGPEHNNAYLYSMNQKYESGDLFDLLDYNKTVQRRRLDNTAEAEYDVSADMLYSGILRVESNIMASSYSRFGLREYRLEKWAEAEDSFLNSVMINHSPVARMALLSIYFKTLRFDQCINIADGLLEEIHNNSMSADIWTTKGHCLLGNGQQTESRAAYEMSLSLDRDKNYRAVKGLSGT
ncbi:MAG: tetratricopeptide (TPR) repeat protein [Paraglaciecola sp.]|jgi:tetratricopeptide (TPR) repeat protein